MAVDSFCDGHDKVYLQLAVSVTAGGPPSRGVPGSHPRPVEIHTGGVPGSHPRPTAVPPRTGGPARPWTSRGKRLKICI